MKQAIILAAGEGQRLRPFTVTKPKVMISIGGRPILQYVIEALAQNGIQNVVLVVRYRKEQIFDQIAEYEPEWVDLFFENKPDDQKNIDVSFCTNLRLVRC